MKHATITLAIATLLGVSACSGCGGTPYKRIADGHRALDRFVQLTEGFDRAVATWARAEHARCKAAHDPKTKQAEFAKCIDKAVKLLRAWTGKVRGKPTGKGVLPAIQSAQSAWRSALDAAFDYVKANEKACAKTDSDDKCKKKLEAWKAAAKPAICALLEIIDRGIKIGAYKAAESAAYKFVKGVALGFAKCGGK